MSKIDLACCARLFAYFNRIRRSSGSGASPVHVPPGYFEMYSKRTGLISYHDGVSGLVWYTALDPEGRLYFHTADRSEWALPKVKTILAHGKVKSDICVICQVDDVSFNFNRSARLPQ